MAINHGKTSCKMLASVGSLLQALQLCVLCWTLPSVQDGSQPSIRLWNKTLALFPGLLPPPSVKVKYEEEERSPGTKH